MAAKRLRVVLLPSACCEAQLPASPASLPSLPALPACLLQVVRKVPNAVLVFAVEGAYKAGKLALQER
jgi:hypothetical protein